MLIRELVFLKDFEPNGEYVSTKLNKLVSVKDAQSSLELLINSGFLSFRNGQWLALDPVLDSGDQLFPQASMVQVHAETLRKWSDNLGMFPSEDLEMGVLNIAMKKSEIPELKKRIREFQDQLIGWLQSEKEPDSLVQLGTYLIPVSTSADVRKK